MKSWPCRCEGCAPPFESCDACGAPEGEVCNNDCSEHPRYKQPCLAMSFVGRLSSLDILLRNLAVAGALCAAYCAGVSALENACRRGLPRQPWYPGCGREVPW